MTTVKQKILLGIAKKRQVDNPFDLQIDANTDMHNIVHVLYRLNRQGMISFKEIRDGTRQMPTKIVLTRVGEKEVRRLQR